MSTRPVRGLGQKNVDLRGRRSPRAIEASTRSGVVDGRSAVADQSWIRYVSPDERTRSLVRTTPEVTTIVVGDTTYEALEAFAGTLSAS